MKNRKILYVLMIIAIILGMLIVWKKGFNYSTLYSSHKRLEVAIIQDHNLNDVKQMAKESFDSDVIVRNSTLFSTSVVVDAKNMTDDQITNFFVKLNDKYGTSFDIKELKKVNILEEMNVESIYDLSDEEVNTLISQIKDKYGYEYTSEELLAQSSSLRLSDTTKVKMFNIIKSFVFPMMISLIIVLVYFAVRYRKLYKNAWILKPLKLAFEMFLNQAFIVAVIAIARIPVANYVPALLAFIWMIQLLSETFKSEEELRKVTAEKE